MVRCVLIFKIIIYSISLLFCQSEISFFIKNKNEIIDSLNLVLKNENSLTGFYKLDYFNQSNKRLIYKYYDEEKIIDTLFVFGLDNINRKMRNKIIERYKSKSINDDFKKIGMKINSENYFINDYPSYKMGIIKNDQLGLLLNFNTQFHSHFSGNFGLTRNYNGYNLYGEINLHLENLKKSADIIDVKWKRLDSLYQFIDLNIFEPYLFSSNYGVRLDYFFGIINGFYIKKESRLNLKFSLSNLFNLDLGYLKGENIPTNKGILNKFENVNYKGLSLLFYSDLLNDRFLPTKGYFSSFNVDFGLNNKSLFANSEIIIKKYFLITNNIYNSFKLNIEGINNFDSIVLKSRYKYFGGSTSLRGYDENQFMSPQYNIYSFDIGYILNSDSHCFLFSDLGLEKLNVFNNIYWGYGIGLKKLNENTMFKISYAFSKQINDLTNGKLHFEILTRL